MSRVRHESKSLVAIAHVNISNANHVLYVNPAVEFATLLYINNKYGAYKKNSVNTNQRQNSMESLDRFRNNTMFLNYSTYVNFLLYNEITAKGYLRLEMEKILSIEYEDFPAFMLLRLIPIALKDASEAILAFF
ncbi:hypothetical protein ACJX0J_012586, partial [Zea mays]